MVRWMINNKKKGTLYIIIAAVSFALMFVMVACAGDLPTLQKVFFRNIVAFIVAIGIIFKGSKEKIIINKKMFLDLTLRSVFGLTSVICNFYAVDHLFLSDANMLMNTNPFFAILFSYIFLKEKIKPYQVIAILIAFVGCLFIIKPSFNLTDYGASLIGLFGGMFSGLAYAWLRKLSVYKIPGKYVVAFFSGFSIIVMFPFMMISFVPMTSNQLVILMLAGVFATFGQFFVTNAYYYAPAKEISGYMYTQVIFTALFGYFLFNQMPDIFSIIGYLTIISTGMFMFVKSKREI